MIENMGKEQKTLPARPVVSVIMNGLNCAQYLQEAIESVFAQTYEDWEIVFWDNASTDSTAEIAKSYGPSVRYFRSDQTYPLGKARNLAIEKARGKYLAFLDSDDIWLPEKLEKQVWAFEKNSAVGLVYCDAIFFNDKGTNYRLYRRKKPPQGKIFRALFKKFYLPLPAVVIKRDALDRINLWFDERFTMVEDADLFMRIAHDYEVAYIDEPLAKWRMHNKSWSNIQKEQFPEELKMMMEKFSALYDNFEENYPKEDVWIVDAL